MTERIEEVKEEGESERRDGESEGESESERGRSLRKLTAPFFFLVVQSETVPVASERIRGAPRYLRQLCVFHAEKSLPSEVLGSVRFCKRNNN